MVPPGTLLSDDARRRLRVLAEFSDLGAGFRIAAKDLEIRGAGSLLGAEQSGHIESVGFETYVRLLEEAMAEVRGEPVPETRDVTLQLGLPLALPPSWIPDESLRMALYKRIAAAGDGRSWRPKPRRPRTGTALRRPSSRAFSTSPGYACSPGARREGRPAPRRRDARDAREGPPARPRPGPRAPPEGGPGGRRPDAFRLPSAFAGLSPHGPEVCGRAARLLATLARPAALAALPPALAGPEAA